ncbi:hypothetical protein PsorP6_003248 [Peronosclerospora sorghi]|uniref:Uncharacterized protein n=1 Tax=Peronosclerospora sorghi TaxID=230839 RepID=A0ACC0VM91_9STRA|nr:hypothetical protein PsorP6_003248 [Peronosclerospora sorghi]
MKKLLGVAGYGGVAAEYLATLTAEALDERLGNLPQRSYPLILAGNNGILSASSLVTVIGAFKLTQVVLNANLQRPLANAPAIMRPPIECVTMMVSAIVFDDTLLVLLTEMAKMHTFCCSVSSVLAWSTVFKTAYWMDEQQGAFLDRSPKTHSRDKPLSFRLETVDRKKRLRSLDEFDRHSTTKHFTFGVPWLQMVKLLKIRILEAKKKKLSQ